MALRRAGPLLAEVAQLMFVFGLVCGVLSVIVFGWDPERALLGALAGTAAFATLDWVTETGRGVPERHEDLLSPPPDAHLDPDPDPRWLWRFMILPLAGLGLAWALSEWGQGAASAAVIPGQLFGYGLSHLVGVVLVRRWEARHGREVLLTKKGRHAVLYAR